MRVPRPHPRRIRQEFRLAAYAVVVNAGNLLLARYAGRGRRLWTMPGGGVEHGEDPYDAVIREVMEETGYTIEVERLLGIHSHSRARPGRLMVTDHHAVRVFYTARIVDGTLRHEVNGSTDLAAWIPLDQLAELANDRADLVDIAMALCRDRPPTGHQ